MVSQSASSPAPLDPAALADSLRPFGESRMLPRAAYVDPAVFACEQQRFFGGGWICVGRSSQVPAAGDLRAGPAVARIAADMALNGCSDVLDASHLGLGRFDGHGRSRLTADPIALPFPEMAPDQAPGRLTLS